MHVRIICKISFSRHPPYINQYAVAILRRNTKLTALHKPPVSKIYFYERQSYRQNSAGFDPPLLKHTHAHRVGIDTVCL